MAAAAAAGVVLLATMAAAEPQRTLDEITIEGEVPLPQVLFISSRETPRYQDHLHRRFLPSSLQLALRTPLPLWLWVMGGAGAVDGNDDTDSQSPAASGVTQ